MGPVGNFSLKLTEIWVLRHVYNFNNKQKEEKHLWWAGYES